MSPKSGSLSQNTCLWFVGHPVIVNTVLSTYSVWIRAYSPFTVCNSDLSVAVLLSTGPGQRTNPQHMFHAFGSPSSDLLCTLALLHMLLLFLQGNRKKKKSPQRHASVNLQSSNRKHIHECECVRVGANVLVHYVVSCIFTVTAEGADGGRGRGVCYCMCLHVWCCTFIFEGKWAEGMFQGEALSRSKDCLSVSDTFMSCWSSSPALGL